MPADAYMSKKVEAVLGTGHSDIIPDVLWGGLLDGTGALIAMTGVRVPHSTFTPTASGVANSTIIDCGVAGTGWTIEGFALFDAATGGQMVIAADVTPLTPTLGDPLAFAPGALAFTYAGA